PGPRRATAPHAAGRRSGADAVGPRRRAASHPRRRGFAGGTGRLGRDGDGAPTGFRAGGGLRGAGAARGRGRAPVRRGGAGLGRLGLRPEPALPESAWREALGVSDSELTLIRCEGDVEAIPREALRPATRAGVRRWAREVRSWTR